MKAVILVGGGGTRLRPLTYAVPKALVPVLNRPLICHLIANLQRHGVTEIVLAASAADRRIEQTLGDGRDAGISLSYCYETEPLGSGLAVKQAARGFEDTFFVCNGDVVTDLDLMSMLAHHRQQGATMSIFLAPVADPSSYGVAEVDDSRRITRFVEKPLPGREPSNLVNAGTWLFEPEVLEHIPDEKMDGSVERLLIPALIADGGLVSGFVSDAYWMDVGTSERYLQVHRDLLDGRLSLTSGLDAAASPLMGEDCRIAPAVDIGPRVMLGARCRVETGVRLAGPSVLGEGCYLGEKAAVLRSVLWSGVRVGAGASVIDSIVGDGCSIGEEAIVEGSVLANGARVLPRAHLVGARLEPNEVAS